MEWDIRNDQPIYTQLIQQVTLAILSGTFPCGGRLPPVRELMTEDGEIVCLIKPQFEAGREKVGKKGVVRDPAVHLEVLESFLDFVPGAGFTVMGLDYSPIKGPEGNIEYLGYLRKGTHPAPELDPAAVVEQSHGALAHGKENSV